MPVLRVIVDLDLLAALDSYVARDPEFSRSSVMRNLLRLGLREELKASAAVRVQGAVNDLVVGASRRLVVDPPVSPPRPLHDPSQAAEWAKGLASGAEARAAKLERMQQ